MPIVPISVQTFYGNDKKFSWQTEKNSRDICAGVSLIMGWSLNCPQVYICCGKKLLILRWIQGLGLSPIVGKVRDLLISFSDILNHSVLKDWCLNWLLGVSPTKPDLNLDPVRGKKFCYHYTIQPTKKNWPIIIIQSSWVRFQHQPSHLDTKSALGCFSFTHKYYIISKGIDAMIDYTSSLST